MPRAGDAAAATTSTPAETPTAADDAAPAVIEVAVMLAHEGLVALCDWFFRITVDDSGGSGGVGGDSGGSGGGSSSGNSVSGGCPRSVL